MSTRYDELMASLEGAARPEQPVAEEARTYVDTVRRHAYRVTDEQVQALRDLGWTDPQLAEAVYVAALFAFFNRVADAFGLDDPHYFDNPPPRGGNPVPPP